MNRINKIVAQQLGINESEIKPESDLREDLGADSLDMVELMMALEEDFNREISDEQMGAVKTVSDLYKLMGVQ